MASACALAIFSGKIIFYFGIAERLRTLRYSLFTEGVVKTSCICRTASCGSAARKVESYAGSATVSAGNQR